MLALYRAGRQADALRAYQRVREVLADQLGIAPGPALQRLERAVLHQAADLDPVRPIAGTVPVAEPAPARPGSPPLVGRDREMELLGRWVGDADGGRGSLVVVTGEAGIGKTAPARYAVSCAAAAGARAAWGRAWEEDGAPPFWQLPPGGDHVAHRRASQLGGDPRLRDPVPERHLGLVLVVGYFVVLSLLTVAPPRLRWPLDLLCAVGVELLVARRRAGSTGPVATPPPGR